MTQAPEGVPMDPFDALSLCAEIAIAITGFSGVVLVFGSRTGHDWDAQDRLRFRMLFTATLNPLFLIGLAFILSAAEFSNTAIWRICSASYVVASGSTAFFNVRAGARLDSGDSELQVPRFERVWRGGALALGIAVLVLVLQIVNLVSLHAFWPVLFGAWWGIALSLFAFVGLLFPMVERG